MSDNHVPPRLLTIPRFAELTHTSASSAYRLAEEKKIPSLKIGGRRLIPVEYLEKLVAAALAE